jgi:outer membrane protease
LQTPDSLNSYGASKHPAAGINYLGAIDLVVNRVLLVEPRQLHAATVHHSTWLLE